MDLLRDVVWDEIPHGINEFARYDVSLDASPYWVGPDGLVRAMENASLVQYTFKVKPTPEVVAHWIGVYRGVEGRLPSQVLVTGRVPDQGGIGYGILMQYFEGS